MKYYIEEIQNEDGPSLFCLIDDKGELLYSSNNRHDVAWYKMSLNSGE